MFKGVLKFQFLFISAWTLPGLSISRCWNTSPIDLPSPVTQIGLTAASPNLHDIFVLDLTLVLLNCLLIFFIHLKLELLKQIANAISASNEKNIISEK